MNIPQVTSHDEAATGDMGQEYLASGKHVALRRWEEDPNEVAEERNRDYETVGYVISGVLELDLDGQTATLKPGDSWLVPAKVKHCYRIIESIVAIEATSPPARFNDRDDPVTN